MLFWHLGGTIAIVRYVFRDENMDLRFLMFGAILPDLIDKPLGLAFFDFFGSTRLYGHTLLFAALVMTVVVLATRRGRPRRRWMAIPIAVMVHLVLDAMWDTPETLWWPFLGGDFTPNTALADDGYVGWLTNWVVWAMEAAGLTYLVFLWQKAGLSQPHKRRAFRETGIIDAPIGR